ncbi:MAG: hypothetical protein HXX11_15415, partial [Desulfuromonadales bacterium]|nr:hypothetical protein [Desulfuromonadales bacterium]
MKKVYCQSVFTSVAVMYYLIIGSSGIAFAVDYKVTDLGVIGGSWMGTSSSAWGINDSGQVVGGSTTNNPNVQS